MGLTTWRNAPHGPVRRTDVTVAKNYLAEDEIRELNRVVSMYLDFAEDQARRRNPMHMAEWVARLDAILSVQRAERPDARRQRLARTRRTARARAVRETRSGAAPAGGRTTDERLRPRGRGSEAARERAAEWRAAHEDPRDEEAETAEEKAMSRAEAAIAACLPVRQAKLKELGYGG